MSERFEVMDWSAELAGICIVDHGRDEMTIVTNIHTIEAANDIVTALVAGCE